MPRVRSSAKNNSTANLGFEAKLWLAADKLRSNMDAAEYKHVVPGFIFLKYVSDAFGEHHAKLVQGSARDSRAGIGGPADSSSNDDCADFPEPHLPRWQIRHDGDTPVGLFRHLADAPDDFPVLREVTV